MGVKGVIGSGSRLSASVLKVGGNAGDAARHSTVASANTQSVRSSDAAVSNVRNSSVRRGGEQGSIKNFNEASKVADSVAGEITSSEGDERNAHSQVYSSSAREHLGN